MPFEAISSSSDSQNPAAPDMPLHAIVKNGQFTLLDVQDTPCYTLTPDAIEELKLPMDALPHMVISLQEQPGEFIADALANRGIDTAWMDEVQSC